MPVIQSHRVRARKSNKYQPKHKYVLKHARYGRNLKDDTIEPVPETYTTYATAFSTWTFQQVAACNGETIEVYDLEGNLLAIVR